MKWTKLRCLVVVVFLLFTAQIAFAQQPSVDETHGDFHWTVAPYAWLTSINGTVGARGYTTNVDVSFADLSKYLNLGAMIHAEVAYKDTVGLFTDFNYSLLGDQASGKRVSLDGKTHLILTDVVAFYRVGTLPLGQAQTSSMDFDLLAGARIWNMGLTLDGDTRRNCRTVSKEITWADPIVGARAIFHLTDKWQMSLRGGVGGFSVSSALTWDTTAVIGYTFWEHGTFWAGYRAVGDNYTSSGKNTFKFDAVLHGPIIGVAFTF